MPTGARTSRLRPSPRQWLAVGFFCPASGLRLISQDFERSVLAKHTDVLIHCRPRAVAELFQSVTRPRLCLVLRRFALRAANHFLCKP